jgi:hypothetical protein
VITDQAQIPDAWPFIEHLRTSLDELETVLGRKARPRKVRRQGA